MVACQDVRSHGAIRWIEAKAFVLLLRTAMKATVDM